MISNVHYLNKTNLNFRKDSDPSYEVFFQKNPAAMYLISFPDGVIENCNQAFVQLLGFDSPLEILGRRFSEFFNNPADYDGFICRFNNTDKVNGDQQCLRKKDTSILWILQDMSIITEPGSETSNILGTVLDITEQKKREEYFQQSAFYDGLTSLPNRSLFLSRLSICFDRATRNHDYQFGVLFLDLDRFKWINDTFGHQLGDELLSAAAKRLSSKIRSVDTVARLGGDEFAVLLTDVKQTSDATRVASRIEAAFQNPFRLTDREVSITVSMGIALSSGQWISEPNASTDSVSTETNPPLRLERPEDLLWEADAVLYRAKALGRARYEIFDSAMQQKILSMAQMEQDLRNAVERDEFRSVYEPIFDFKTGRVAGFEPQIRWHHPVRGILNTQDFQLLAERLGLQHSIDLLLLRRAIRESAEFWDQTGSSDLYVSINASASLIRSPHFKGSLIEILNQSKLDPARLHLEVSESSLIENFETLKNTLNGLRTLGMSVALDDFGTGFSSLRGLPEFPVDTLKLDASLIAGMKIDQTYQDVVGTLITLGKSLGLNVCALGVETREQLFDLRRLGCDAGQGSFFSEVVDIKTAPRILSENSRYN